MNEQQKKAFFACRALMFQYFTVKELNIQKAIIIKQSREKLDQLSLKDKRA